MVFFHSSINAGLSISSMIGTRYLKKGHIYIFFSLIEVFFVNKMHIFLFFNQRRIINIVNIGTRYLKKGHIYIFFSLIEVFFVNKMHIFLNIQFVYGVCYRINYCVFLPWKNLFPVDQSHKLSISHHLEAYLTDLSTFK